MKKIIALVMMAGLAYGIAVPPDPAPPALPPTCPLSLAGVHNYKGSSSVAISSNVILTAYHVADDAASGTLVINGTNYYEVATNYHPSGLVYDYALVEFDKPFPYWYDISTNLQTVGTDIIVAGYGCDGAVIQGGWYNSGANRGVLRWGTQKITTVFTNGAFGKYHFDFWLGETVKECGVNAGDSGGPWFVEEDGKWKVSCISQRAIGISYYTAGSGMAVDAAYSWITNTVTLTSMPTNAPTNTTSTVYIDYICKTNGVAAETYSYEATNSAGFGWVKADISTVNCWFTEDLMVAATNIHTLTFRTNGFYSAVVRVEQD